ncbi:hypothetical protein EKO04_010803 [Ascochyta lentis]|uniref:J domain-containing protein n=1 Tax=Ascochyta lentis TaxID=205686 RepID=A0A8H7IU79_9PLEO|nr:hypothetical protein EKO04_010803 [Ascochyta lentis]
MVQLWHPGLPLDSPNDQTFTLPETYEALSSYSTTALLSLIRETTRCIQLANPTNRPRYTHIPRLISVRDKAQSIVAARGASANVTIVNHAPPDGLVYPSERVARVWAPLQSPIVSHRYSPYGYLQFPLVTQVVDHIRREYVPTEAVGVDEESSDSDESSDSTTDSSDSEEEADSPSPERPRRKPKKPTHRPEKAKKGKNGRHQSSDHETESAHNRHRKHRKNQRNRQPESDSEEKEQKKKSERRKKSHRSPKKNEHHKKERYIEAENQAPPTRDQGHSSKATKRGKPQHDSTMKKEGKNTSPEGNPAHRDSNPKNAYKEKEKNATAPPKNRTQPNQANPTPDPPTSPDSESDTTPRSAYETLDLPPSASISEVKASLHRLALLFHPDKQVGKTVEERERAGVRMREVNWARGVLLGGGGNSSSRKKKSG